MLNKLSWTTNYSITIILKIVLRWVWWRFVFINFSNEIIFMDFKTISFYNHLCVCWISQVGLHIIWSHLFWITIVPWWLWWRFSQVLLFADFLCDKYILSESSWPIIFFSLNITLNNNIFMVISLSNKYSIIFCLHKYLLLLFGWTHIYKLVKRKTYLYIGF